MLIRNRFWEERGLYPSSRTEFLSGDIIRFKSNLSAGSFFRTTSRTLFFNGEEVLLDNVEYISHSSTGLKFYKCTVAGRRKHEFFRVIDSDNIVIYNNLLLSYANRAKGARFPYNKKYWRDYFKLKGAFAEVQYIFASTIHKLQGSTYDTAYIDLASLLDNKQLSDDQKYRLAYVAVTRARKNIKILY